MSVRKTLLRASLPLLALACPASAWAANANGTARLNLLKPFSITRKSDLDFATLFPPASGTGTVRIDPNTGAATYSGAAVVGATPTTRATFTGVASRLSLIIVTVPLGPVTLTRAGGTETLTATNFTLDSAGFIRLVGTTPFTIGVGATLNVPSTAVEGSYVGTFTVTANYF